MAETTAHGRGRAAPSPPGPKSDQIGPNPVIDAECPLLGAKRKSISGDWMSAYSQEETFDAGEGSRPQHHNRRFGRTDAGSNPGLATSVVCTWTTPHSSSNWVNAGAVVPQNPIRRIHDNLRAHLRIRQIDADVAGMASRMATKAPRAWPPDTSTKSPRFRAAKVYVTMPPALHGLHHYYLRQAA